VLLGAGAVIETERAAGAVVLAVEGVVGEGDGLGREGLSKSLKSVVVVAAPKGVSPKISSMVRRVELCV
jgi:hypothetical protein